jgi:uncharacterized protein with HEPN domain
MEVKEAAARILARKADIMTRRSLHPGSAEADRGLGFASVMMPNPSQIARLRDIIEAIELIRNELAGVTLHSLESDIRKRWLVERGIEIISQASRHLNDELKGRHPEISWSKVVGIGNVLRYDAFRPSVDCRWSI